MQKEALNPIEHSFEETGDSCPKCGNTLMRKQESNRIIKYCVTESFDVKSGKVTPCGFVKTV